ncbi:hypothetical protein D3C71_1283120 [compost metagenome]
MHLHSGMAALEIRQAWNQPHHGDRGFAGHHQGCLGIRLLQLRQTRLQLLEQALRHRKQLTTRIGQENSPISAFKQRQSQRLFQQSDLTADRAMGDVQLLRRAAEGLMAGGCIEDAQRI